MNTKAVFVGVERLCYWVILRIISLLFVVCCLGSIEVEKGGFGWLGGGEG